MKKKICCILGILMGLAGIIPAGLTKEAVAGVSVEVNIGPPVIMMDEPSEVVYAPGLGVYFVPDAEFEIFYYSGFWWSRRGNYWYSSRYYRSGWAIARNQSVPRPIFNIPRDYRTRFSREPRIRYNNWKGRPAQPKNVQRNAENNRRPAGNFEKAQPNEKNIERDSGQRQGQGQGDGKSRELNGRGKGVQEGNKNEGGRGRE